MTNRRRLIASALLKWFEQNKRNFPWREHFDNPDPYLILFAELMLQRTRADQVAKVYSEFINRYPSFEMLQKARKDEVRKLLQPLGLNWRVEGILGLIDALNSEFDGKIPTDYESLKKLPGVGQYIASAVTCYAFNQHVVAIDVNVVRIISRIFGLTYTRHTKSTTRLRHMANCMIPAGKARDFNLALLDFGATVCRAEKPLCPQCPVNRHCSYYASRSAG